MDYSPFTAIRILSRAGIVLFILLWAFHGLTCMAGQPGFTKSQKVFLTNLSGLGAVTAWGTAKWDYFSRSPKKENEGWFSEDTLYGGADKWGHFYSSYGLTRALAQFYENWGYANQKAGRLGALSSFALLGYMELGDAFSDYGFSHEDFLMNLVGSAVGFLFHTRPDLSRKIDLRIEYTPDFDQTDVFTDYENMKFIMAIKPGGFKAVRRTFARYLEVHLGYYTRGYPGGRDRERTLYIGIGLCLPELFSSLSMPKASKFFNYIQPPGTYLPLEKTLSR